MPDHVHMCIEIPPQVPGGWGDRASEGGSAFAVARQLCGKERNITAEHFWARGYAVSTVGFKLQQVRPYIREQEDANGNGGRS